MLVFLKARLVFFATPKTASTSIEMAFDSICDIRISKMPNAKHTPFRKYKRLLEPFIMTLLSETPDTMAIIREPIDWLGSWYRYRSRTEITGSENSTAEISFDSFVEAYLQEEPPAFAQLGSQSRFLSDKDGTLGMSHLFRYDDLASGVRFLQNRLSQPVSLGHANASPKADLALAPSLETAYRERFARDFELYECLLPEPE